jgi:putative Mn2+ efflux pump MntP
VIRDNSHEGGPANEPATAHGAALVLLGLSVSLDELAVGFAFGLSRVPVLPALVLIAVQAFVVSQLGFRLGGRLSAPFRQRTERAAGLALGLLGTWLVLQQALK